MCEEVETAIKVVVVGNGAVGKSSMIQRYCRGIFTRDYKKTIGVDFLERQIDIDGEEVRLMLWDTAGQEEFDAITKAYYRGAHAAVVAFSLTDRDSFDAVESWIKKVENECYKIPMLLVMNKLDLLNEALVLPEEAEALSRRLGIRLFMTSVKDGLRVDDVFRELSEDYLRSLAEEDEIDQSTPTIGSAASPPPSLNNGDGVSAKGAAKYKSRKDKGTLSLRASKQHGKGKRRLSFKCTLL